MTTGSEREGPRNARPLKTSEKYRRSSRPRAKTTPDAREIDCKWPPNIIYWRQRQASRLEDVDGQQRELGGAGGPRLPIGGSLAVNGEDAAAAHSPQHTSYNSSAIPWHTGTYCHTDVGHAHLCTSVTGGQAVSGHGRVARSSPMLRGVGVWLPHFHWLITMQKHNHHLSCAIRIGEDGGDWTARWAAGR